MSKRINPALIGTFVIGALVLIAVAITMLGSGQLFHHRHIYVLYFRSNVNGLNVDAPVKFHGVEIGSVNRILLSLSQVENAIRVNNPAMIRVPVLIELDENKIISHGGKALDLDDPRNLKRLIAAGLRGQLAFESLLTGMVYVDLDMYPGTTPHFVLPPNSGFQEIPTQPTMLEQVQEEFRKVVSRLSQVDFPAVSRSMVEMTDSISDLAHSPQLQATIDQLRKTAKSTDEAAQSAKRMMDTVRAQVVPLSTSMRAASESTAVTMRQARVAMAAAQQAFVSGQLALDEARKVLDPASPVTYQLSEALENIASTARSIKALSDLLERDPSVLIRGRAVAQDER